MCVILGLGSIRHHYYLLHKEENENMVKHFPAWLVNAQCLWVIWGTLGHLKCEGAKMVSLIQLLGSFNYVES